MNEAKTVKPNYVPMYNWACGYLAEKLVVSLADFETALFNQFQNELAAFTNINLNGKNRTHAENLADWVKARLTKNSNWFYFRVRGERWVCFLDVVASIHTPCCRTYTVRATDLAKVVRTLEKLLEQ